MITDIHSEDRLVQKNIADHLREASDPLLLPRLMSGETAV